MATSGRNYQYFGVNFDNWRITDLSGLSGNQIVSATNPSDLTVTAQYNASYHKFEVVFFEIRLLIHSKLSGFNALKRHDL